MKKLVTITPENMMDEGIFWAVNEEYSAGINQKLEWYKKDFIKNSHCQSESVRGISKMRIQQTTRQWLGHYCIKIQR